MRRVNSGFPASALPTYSNPLFHRFNSSNSSSSDLLTYNFHFWNGISLTADVQLMDNGGVKRFRRRPVKAPQGGEENVLKGVFSQNLRWLRLQDYHRLYIPVLKIGRQWRIPTAGCALSNRKKLTFFFLPPPFKRSRPSKGPPYGRAEDGVFFYS